MMSMKYIRNYYKVPAKRGARVRYWLNCKKFIDGVITSAKGQYINIRRDGEKHSTPHHPTWHIEYL